ncbi:MAG: bacteriocin-protection protein, partial [Bacteroidetes bacterium]|nr:bacteriocin-protection protein [Bacteroidota bacterium]
MEPVFFSAPDQFRAWLEKNHDKEKEILVLFHKTKTGKQSMTWPQSVDEALCFGWIDGIRKSIDDSSYTIRFTPRKPRSIWSAVNMKRAEQLIKQGLMKPAGMAAFEKLDA